VGSHFAKSCPGPPFPLVPLVVAPSSSGVIFSKWFEQRCTQLAVFPGCFFEGRGEEFALFGFGLFVEGVGRRCRTVPEFQLMVSR